VNHRIRFIPGEGADTRKQPTKSNAFVCFGPRPARFTEAFRQFGRVILPLRLEKQAMRTCAVCGNAFFTTRAGVTPLAELSHNPVPFDEIGLERSTVALLGRVTHQALIPSVAFSVCLYTATEKGVSHSGTTCIQAGCGMQTSEGASTLLEHLLRVTSPPLYERRLLPRFYPSLNGLIRKLLNLLASPRGFEPLLPP
jgi:hypothetical protein